MDEKPLMKKEPKKIALFLILLGLGLIIFLSISCQKSPTPESKKEVQAQSVEVKKQPSEIKLEVQTKQKEQPLITPETKEEKEKPIDVKPILLTEEDQKEFKGGWLMPGNITQERAIKYLQILLKGDFDTIRWYKDHAEEFGELGEKGVYQIDICSMVQALAKEKNKRGYNLILEVIKRKADYPKGRACAAEAIGWYGELKKGKWHGDKRAIPILKEIINDKDPEVRLQVAGSLLSLGVGDIALPVLDELAKAGIHQSTFALNKLFPPEETEEDGRKRIVISHTKLWDERGKEILIKALHYPSDEVKAFGAARMADIGERTLAEPVLLDILKRLKDIKLKDYGLTKEEYRKYGKGGKEEAYQKYLSDSRALDTAINFLGGPLRSKKAIPYLNDVINNPETAGFTKSWAKDALKKIERK